MAHSGGPVADLDWLSMVDNSVPLAIHRPKMPKVAMGTSKPFRVNRIWIFDGFTKHFLTFSVLRGDTQKLMRDESYQRELDRPDEGGKKKRFGRDVCRKEQCVFHSFPGRV